MIGSGGVPPVTANGTSIDPTSDGKASGPSQTCDHDCSVVILAIAISILSLFFIGILAFGLFHRRREMRKNAATDQETGIAMRKPGPESETSSVAEGFGDLRAVTDLEDDAEAARDSEKPSRLWRPGDLALKTSGWWRM